MKKDIYDKQIELSMIRNERNRVKRRLEGAEVNLREAREIRNRLHKQLTKEQQDVVKLGKFSIMNKINEWTGKWDEQMEKEMAEVAEAELRYNEAEKNVIDLEAEVNRLQKEMKNPDFTYIDEDWAAFLQEKETWIRRYDSEANALLHKIADERVSIGSILREVTEAEEAGRIAIRALDHALDKLGSAEGMSMWDTFLGGGMIVSALKYSEINQSDDHIHRAERALRHFETELMDVQDITAESLTVNKRDIFTFTDLFFDNIFSDFMVHSRITDTKSKLNTISSEVRRVLDQLARKRDEMNAALERLDQEERMVIER
ncbi:hypothetical protein [Sporosarcina ureilytica]|uniref:Uncharacterized protein n=1 Tax=Sporosarcina ureilytica TaxID=298596 RepID=A0A1D8JCJ2_9BACL|nr:hypothetical protein [Sporosarcina ureilytica]AOV06426.1 hypothetical protein BI350_01590 [Sporosarcina ureilytica]